MKKPKDKGGLIAAFINPNSAGGVDFYDRACLLWDEKGTIEYFSAEIPGPERLNGYEVLLREKMIAMPGLIDLHTHLPQYEFAGQGAEALLPWLEKYTFPQESRFSDERVAEIQSKNFFASCLSEGTTTVVAYLSSFATAAEIAFASSEDSGIRSFLGLTLMDRNVPQALLTTENAASKAMQHLIEKYHKKNKTEFVVTPRFAISCTSALLTLCGEISRAHATLLQTHISENLDEIATTLKLFSGAKSYAEVYDSHGCLHTRTLLGHGIHLTDVERALVRDRQAVVVHCPVSNNFLGSGIMPYKKFQSEGLRLGLGTDVAAGYSLSLIHEARQMMEVSKLLLPGAAVSGATALHQATLGNAAALGREQDLGSFATGKRADVVIIDDKRIDTMQGNLSNHYRALNERMNRILYRNHSGIVERTLVDGEAVFVRN